MINGSKRRASNTIPPAQMAPQFGNPFDEPKTVEYAVCCLLFDAPGFGFPMIADFMVVLVAFGVEDWEDLKTCCRCETMKGLLSGEFFGKGIYGENIETFFEGMAKACVVEQLDKDFSK